MDGVRLGSIVPGSGAERAGLQAGDVLVRLDDTGLQAFSDLRALLDRHRPGDTLQLVYLRDGARPRHVGHPRHAPLTLSQCKT